jgi:hypothetical protein
VCVYLCSCIYRTTFKNYVLFKCEGETISTNVYLDTLFYISNSQDYLEIQMCISHNIKPLYSATQFLSGTLCYTILADIVIRMQTFV